MYALLTDCTLLAERVRLEDFGSGFRRSPRLDVGDVLVVSTVLVGIVLAVWLLSRWLARRERRGACNSRIKLFCSLCKAHRLRWWEYWLLWRVARHQRLRDPARLFLEPDRFDPANLGPIMRSPARAVRLASLRGRLFVGLSEEQSEPPRPPGPSPQPAPQTRAKEHPPTPLLPVSSPPKLDLPQWPAEVERSGNVPTD